MTGQNFMLLVSALFTILGIIWTTYGVPYIKAKVGAEELVLLGSYVDTIVRCLQQIYTPEQWQEKKANAMIKVRAFINKNLSIDITDEQLSDWIESSVYDMKMEIKALTNVNE